jgi:hypothetical protein
MSNDLRITQIKLKLLEGQDLTIQEQQMLSEVAPMLLFGNWLRQKATAWIKDQIAQAVKGQIVAKDAWTQADQAVAAALGQEDKEIGSTMTAYIMSLIQGGNPIQAAIQMGVGAAKEYAMKASGAQDAIDQTKQAVTGQAVQALAQVAPGAAALVPQKTPQGNPQAQKADPQAQEIKQFALQLEPIADDWEEKVQTVKPPQSQQAPKLG